MNRGKAKKKCCAALVVFYTCPHAAMAGAFLNNNLVAMKAIVRFTTGLFYNNN